jgi:hypothetical protein
MMHSVKLFLQRQKDRPLAVDLGPCEVPSTPLAHRSGLLGWIGRQGEHFKKRWHESRTGLTGKMHQVWDWLHKRTPADEPLLMRLRKADRVEVYHPESLSPEEARSLWNLYLDHRRRRHLPRLAINLVITPFTVLLIPLPGPNLVGFWFAYRSIHHLLILYGLVKARKQKLEVSFHPTSDHEQHRAREPQCQLDGTKPIGDDSGSLSKLAKESRASDSSEPLVIHARHDS